MTPDYFSTYANFALDRSADGDRFMTEIDGPSLGDITRPEVWDGIITEGRRVVQRLCELETVLGMALEEITAANMPYLD
jgi:hypothetical protein